MQAADVMVDEECVQELCRQAACGIFGCPGRLLPRPDRVALNECGAPSEELAEVRCFKELCRQVARWFFGSWGGLFPRPDQSAVEAASQECNASFEDRVQVRYFSVCSQPQFLT